MRFTTSSITRISLGRFSSIISSVYQWSSLVAFLVVLNRHINWYTNPSCNFVDGKDGPADVCVIELGGTVGDIESMPFIEALRQLSFIVGQENFCLIYVSLIPVLGVVGEQKTKPTQHSVRELRALGLTPNLLACRSAQPLLDNTKKKLSLFCHVPAANILNIHDVPNIWHVPLLLRNQNAQKAILKQLNLLDVAQTPDLQEWTMRAETFDNITDTRRRREKTQLRSIYVQRIVIMYLIHFLLLYKFTFFIFIFSYIITIHYVISM